MRSWSVLKNEDRQLSSAVQFAVLCAKANFAQCTRLRCTPGESFAVAQRSVTRGAVASGVSFAYTERRAAYLRLLCTVVPVLLILRTLRCK